MPTVFLTGFPGFLGSALVERLLDRYDEATVTCLVQSKYRDEAEDRAAEIEGGRGGDGGDGLEGDGRIELVEGDVTEGDLGLGDDDEAIRGETVEVYHLAAIYDLTMDRAPGKAVNVEGTRNVLEFAAGVEDLDRFQYVSTVVVAGTYEGRFTEEMLQEGQLFANYYESTKHVAEVLVRQRMDELPTTIYRPGVAVGDSETGETRKYDGPYAFLDALAELGDNAVVPAPRGASDAEFNVVPRDYIVDALAYLSGIDESEGKTYHLADPDPPTTTELVKAFGEAMGKKRTVVVPSEGDRGGTPRIAAAGERPAEERGPPLPDLARVVRLLERGRGSGGLGRRVPAVRDVRGPARRVLPRAPRSWERGDAVTGCVASPDAVDSDRLKEPLMHGRSLRVAGTARGDVTADETTRCTEVP